jgi:mannose/fructose/N-acetylgalactosamine-specific phosphotransferase system component IID
MGNTKQKHGESSWMKFWRRNHIQITTKENKINLIENIFGYSMSPLLRKIYR